MTHSATPPADQGPDSNQVVSASTASPDLVAAMATEQVGIERALRRAKLPMAYRIRKLSVGAAAGPAWASSREGRPDPSALVSMGFACGLQEPCELGHVILSQMLLAEGETEVFHSEPRFLELAVEACQQAGIPYHIGASLTVLKPALKSSEKESLGRQTGALSCAMEDYWLAKEAHRAGVPFLSARVILDPVEQDLPAAIGNLAYSQGLSMVLRLLAQSWRLPILVRLAFQGARAQRRLGSFATTLCSRLLETVGPRSTLSAGGA